MSTSPRANSESPWEDMVLVGFIARPHGIRGEVIINPETDFVEQRFRTGAILWCRTARGVEPLTVATMRLQKGRPIVGFDGCGAIADVERLTGAELRVPEALLQPLDEGTYYLHELIGCAVETIESRRIGTVVRVDAGGSGSLIAVQSARGEVLIPLAQEICVEIDVRAKRIRVAPPEGLLDVNA